MAYPATVANLLDRKDARTIGDLVADDGDQVSRSELLDTNHYGNGIVQACLDDAQGDLQASILAGGRYDADDFAELTGADLAYLLRIQCELAMYYLIVRRPEANQKLLEYYAKLRETILEPLRTGENVLNDAESIEAGKPSLETPTLVEWQQLGQVRDRSDRYFPRRHIPGRG